VHKELENTLTPTEVTSRPPPGNRPPFYTPKREEATPCQEPGFWLKVLKVDHSGRREWVSNSETGITEGFHFLTVLTKSQISLASLVSFGRFVNLPLLVKKLFGKREHFLVQQRNGKRRECQKPA